FDLQTRLFKYPCSYLIYSQGFAKLPKEVKDHVYKRLNEVLTGQDTSEAYAHLSPADRAVVLEILRQRVAEFPRWQELCLSLPSDRRGEELGIYWPTSSSPCPPA